MASVTGALAGGLGVMGRVLESIARHAGLMGQLAWRSAVAVATGKMAFRDFLHQCYAMGLQSLPIVCVTGTLSGIVTSQQGGYQMTGGIPAWVLGSVVTSSVILELGPVLTAVVLIGRVGARITAELGTMQVSEQIDALHSLGRDPVVVLAAPRILAGLVTTPALVGIANVIGVISGMIAAEFTIHLGNEAFLYGARTWWHTYDLVYSMMKAIAFGYIIPLIAVHKGFLTRGGAEGVGQATTSSVVFMIVAVLVCDAMFPPLFLN
jgi:phospholipid/cholesterol/gamma-HCH transport system permease protein